MEKIGENVVYGSHVLQEFGVESKAERLSISLQFPIVDKLIREHRSPGASEVVVGVQNMRRGLEGVV